jgi:hypothetical protein
MREKKRVDEEDAREEEDIGPSRVPMIRKHF